MANIEEIADDSAMLATSSLMPKLIWPPSDRSTRALISFGSSGAGTILHSVSSLDGLYGISFDKTRIMAKVKCENAKFSNRPTGGTVLARLTFFALTKS